MPKPYNGHHCWNCWNVSLWIGNDEGLYHLALDCKRGRRTVAEAAESFIDHMRACGSTATPDGAVYTLPGVRSAIKGLE
jgi:hypothetical protein